MFGKLFSLLLLVILLSCSFERGHKQILDDEKQIYSVIIDSLYNDSYDLIFIEDSSHSINQYIQKNLFSEILFGQELDEYYSSFFKKKQCDYDMELVHDFIDNNRLNYFMPGNYSPGRNFKYVTYSNIYYYINGLHQKKNPLIKTSFTDSTFGVISFSRAGFNNDQTEAFLEVNVFRIQKGEVFFAYLKKKSGQWHSVSNCYMYGPYKIRDKD